MRDRDRIDLGDELMRDTHPDSPSSKQLREESMPARGLIEAFTGQRVEDPRVVRRAKAREAFYSRLFSLIVLALVCGTVLAVVWMIVR